MNPRMLKQLRTALVVMVVGLFVGGCHFPVSFWPLEPTNVVHPIGNSGGEFQQYGGSPYFHEGIDIVDDNPAPSGPFVRTVRAGTVSLSDSGGASSLYNGLTVFHGDANNSAYKYWHLDFNSIRQAVRDADDNNTTLAANSQVSQLVNWTACGYHHLHYETCESNGCEEPVWSLNPRNDTNGPVIINISFTDNGSSSVFAPGFPDTVVSGQVDIVANAYDRQFVTATQDHKTGIIRIGYRVYLPLETEPIFSGSIIDFTTIPPDSQATILLRNTAPFDSNSNYCSNEAYYYVVTNVDDSDSTNFSETFAWDTTTLANGRYRIEVIAWDASFNSFSLSKQVRIAN